jgi:hypothetical protein
MDKTYQQLSNKKYLTRKLMEHIQFGQSRRCCEAWTYACHLSVEVIVMLEYQRKATVLTFENGRCG